MAVLITDDDPANRFALRMLLRGAGFESLEAEDGLVALEKLKEQFDDIDIVLSDMKMPNLDGFGLIRAIREEPRYEGLPVIALTGMAMAEDVQKCLDAGANTCVTKPVDGPTLIASIKECLGG